jgi:hypothetical protein
LDVLLKYGTCMNDLNLSDLQMSLYEGGNDDIVYLMTLDAFLGILMPSMMGTIGLKHSISHGLSRHMHTCLLCDDTHRHKQ